MDKQLHVSVVINTYNRAKSLKTTLESLFHQTDRRFEVIVVNGPSTDETEEVLSGYTEKIKLLSCPVRNLSVSRNIGIEASSGEIVAFIDDDAVADPNWVKDLIDGYDAPDVGGVGGIVYDHTGMQLQYRYSSCDRNGDTDFGIMPPFDPYCVPMADKFLYLQGTNCSFQKSCLEEIGGFDEEFEYYLDEVDVCMRMIDLGYKIKPLERAAVHHKYMKSFLRNEEKVVLHPYSTVKNKYYFAVKNHRDKDLDKVKQALKIWVEEVKNGGRENFLRHKITKEELEIYLNEVEQACRDGEIRGMQKDRTRKLHTQKKGNFLPFEIVERKEKPLKICYLSKEYPPVNFGGIGRYTYDLATTFAAKGHEVHVITEGTVQDAVDFEDGVWIHRLVSKLYEPFADMVLGWNFSLQARNYFELERIYEQGAIDIVLGPVWLCESGMANCSGKYPTTLTLMTTQKILNHLTKEPVKGSHEYKLMKLEEMNIQQHKNIHAISRSILENCRESIQDDANVFIAPLGCRDLSLNYTPVTTDDKTVIFTVGRLEHRKGIDLLLKAAETILSDSGYQNVYFVIAGKETVHTLSGISYKDEFLKRNKGKEEILSHVSFLGEISEDELMQNYADADISCVPSRYESFGIVLLEGMSFSNAIVAADTGGMKDIVKNGTTGLLFESENLSDLIQQLKKFLDDPQYREQSALAAREEYLAAYSLDAVYAALYEKYCEISKSFVPDLKNTFDQEKYARMISYAEACNPEKSEKSVAWLLREQKTLERSAAVFEDTNRSFSFKMLRCIYRAIRRVFPSAAVKLRSRSLFLYYRCRNRKRIGEIVIRYLKGILLLPLRIERVAGICVSLMNHDELLTQIGNMENITWDRIMQINQRLQKIETEYKKQQNAIESAADSLAVRMDERTENISSFISEMRKESHYHVKDYSNRIADRLNERFMEVQSGVEDYGNRIVDRLNERLMVVRSEILFEIMRNESMEGIKKKKTECRVLNERKLDDARRKNIVRLNIGAGHLCFDDYINIDEREIRNIDIVADARKLPFDENDADEIYASHLIEHFTKNEFEKTILPYWYGLLKEGGKIRVILPDLESMIFHYAKEEYGIRELREVVYGLQEYPGDIHYALYGRDELKEMFENLGMKAEYVFWGRRNGKCYDMELEGIR